MHARSDTPRAAPHWMLEAGNAAPSADNGKPWLFEWNGTSCRVAFHRRGASTLLGATHQATLVGAGALLENLEQAAEHLAVPLRLELGDLETSYFTVTSYREPRGELGAHPLVVRRTDRAAYARRSVPAELVSQLRSDRQDAVRALVFTGSDDVARGTKLLTEASRVRFASRALHEHFVRSIDWAGAGLGIAPESLALPQGGMTLLRAMRPWPVMAALDRLGLTSFLAQLEMVQARRAPALIAIVGPAGATNAFAAGRLMQRLWLALTARGLTAQPYYALTQRLLLGGEDGFAARCAGWTGESGTFVHLVMRTGFPTKPTPGGPSRRWVELTQRRPS
jgi:hypothetical protein